MRYLTAGESHGKCLVAIIEGLPSGLCLTAEDINKELSRRQQGYGRGDRMKIEDDAAEILAGVRAGKTLGSPIALSIKNRDWPNWESIMTSRPEADLTSSFVSRPRPGHADLAGAIKYRHDDMRNVLERSSARETAARVAVGAVAKIFLQALGIEVFSHVLSIGSSSLQDGNLSFDLIKKAAPLSPVYCADKQAAQRMMAEIDKARERGDTLGGVFEVIGLNIPLGLGSYVHWDRKLDGQLAQGLMSIQGIKAVEIGMGFAGVTLPGSKVHDEILYSSEQGFYHRANRAGGLEGGVTNGEPLIIRGGMKPIPTLMQPLKSVNYLTKETVLASVERSDVCAVPAAAVIGEAVVAFILAQAVLEKFGGDCLAEIAERLEQYRQYVRQV